MYDKLRRTFKIAGKTISKAGFDKKCWNPGKREGILAGKYSQTALTNSSSSSDLQYEPFEEPGTNKMIELHGTISNTAMAYLPSESRFNARMNKLLSASGGYNENTASSMISANFDCIFLSRTESRTKSSIDRSTSDLRMKKICWRHLWSWQVLQELVSLSL